MVTIQLRRLLKSKFLYISLLVGILITVTHYLQTTITIFESNKADLHEKQSIIPDSTYLLWLNASKSEITDLFFILLPILAALPFSTQFLIDRKTKYYELMMMKSGKYKYFFSMLTVSAFSGFIAIAIPILINFLLFSLTFPAIHPDPFVYYTHGIFSFRTLFYSLQLNFPLIHTLFYILLSGLIGSLFAVFSAALCFHIRFSLIILVIPVIISILISGFSELAEAGLSPINFLDMSSTIPVYLWCVIPFCLLMIILTFILSIIGVRKIVR